MKQVGELSVVAQEDVRQDLQAMFRGAIRAHLFGGSRLAASDSSFSRNSFPVKKESERPAAISREVTLMGRFSCHSDHFWPLASSDTNLETANPLYLLHIAALST